MVAPEDFLLSSYCFSLPEELIAQNPPKVRGDSRLLVVDRDTESLVDAKFTDIINFLPENCLLVANNSRVIPARIYGKRQSGGRVEFLLLTPLPLIQEEESKKRQGFLKAEVEGLLRSSKQVKQGETIIFSPNFSLELVERGEFGKCKVELHWKGNLETHFTELGQLPLPPYIHRPEGAEKGSWGADTERYQTTYSRTDKVGSVAAPTAGLHFTKEIKDAIIASGREWAEATLYVGYGTFSPVRSQDIREHQMHAEYAELSEATATLVMKAKREKRPIIAIGTTSARILEGLFMARQQEGKKGLAGYSGWINIFLYPGKPFSLIDGILTNFHLPESSLLMLISGFVGREKILRTYQHAIKEKYRFFSYGDAMLICSQQKKA